MPFIAVTSFLCLRFISPAIMAPKLFHLRERHADARTSRTLLLLAKVRDCGRWREVLSWLLNRGPCLDCRVFLIGSRKALWQATVPSCDTALHSLQSFLMVTQSHG